MTKNLINEFIGVPKMDGNAQLATLGAITVHRLWIDINLANGERVSKHFPPYKLQWLFDKYGPNETELTFSVGAFRQALEEHNEILGSD